MIKNVFSKLLFALFLTSSLFFTSCEDTVKEETNQPNPETKDMKLAQDFHSFSEPNDARISHLYWKATIDFNDKIIDATAEYDILNLSNTDRIILDLNDLEIDSVSVDGNKVEYKIGDVDVFKGQSLTIPIKSDSKKVSIRYKTNPDAKALLWVEGESPFLFTQSQAILGRTWIPIQDSPGVRFTYTADVTVPTNLLAMMSATNPQEKNESGIYHFKMDQPVPAYLMALAVGDVEFRAISENTGVYATKDLIDAAEYEFQEMDEMLDEAEKLYGKYAWERYDVLVLPAAFPFGGMENPRLTFATPTIIAGDRSLVALIAHEMAHSWSGNLVTNATWDDFWLNEGFTVYFEQRIMEAVYGAEYAEMLAKLTKQAMYEEEQEIYEEHPHDTKLKLELKDRDPDDGMTTIPYDKGYFFLRLIEETVGREKFDSFLKNYFDTFAFKVMDTDTFIAYLKANLLTDEFNKTVRMDDWIFGERIPDNIPVITSTRIDKVDEIIKKYKNKEITNSDIPWNDWVYQEKYRFIKNLPEGTDANDMEQLDADFNITQTGNMEILFVWLEQSVNNKYTPAYERLESFLINVGRRKFLTPLYKAMLKTDQSEMALDIYEKARPNYHAVATSTMDDLFKENQD